MQPIRHDESTVFLTLPRMLLITICAVGLSTAGCHRATSFPEPDLIPEGRSGAQGPNTFCNLNDGGDLLVRVRNQTNNDVLVQTKTTVTFSTGDPADSFTQTTAPMPGGSSVTHTFPIPNGCFNPDCSFTIEVDSENDVDESHGPNPDNHETNNVEAGICIG